MVGVTTQRGLPLERTSPTLFLAAGVLLTAYASFNALDAFTTVVYPNLENVAGPAGFALGFVGVLGLYPGLVAHHPRLARVGAGCVSLGAVGFSVFAVVNLGAVVGALEGPPAWLDGLLVLVVLGMVPGYLAFGVASLRADTHSRTLGLLLLAPPAVFATMLAGGAVLGGSAVGVFLLGSGQAISHLAIGATLHGEGGPADRTSSRTDAAT
jgi:hypothetical protein